MKKEQLKEAVGELNCVDTVFEADGVSYIDTAVRVMQVYDLIDQLDESRKVIIPQFVADHIRFTEDDVSPRTSMGEAHISKELNVWLAKTEDYMTYPNQEKFMRAWLDGYEVEKEKLYYIPLGILRLGDKPIYLQKTLDGLDVDWSPPEHMYRYKANYHFTEKEIKDYDERYWSFAVEVAE